MKSGHFSINRPMITQPSEDQPLRKSPSIQEFGLIFSWSKTSALVEHRVRLFPRRILARIRRGGRIVRAEPIVPTGNAARHLTPRVRVGIRDIHIGNSRPHPISSWKPSSSSVSPGSAPSSSKTATASAGGEKTGGTTAVPGTPISASRKPSQPRRAEGKQS